MGTLFVAFFCLVALVAPIVMLGNLLGGLTGVIPFGIALSQVLSGAFGAFLAYKVLPFFHRKTVRPTRVAREGIHVVGSVLTVTVDNDSAYDKFTYTYSTGGGRPLSTGSILLAHSGLAVGHPVHVIYDPEDPNYSLLFFRGAYTI